jgi:hypothetical protein
MNKKILIPVIFGVIVTIILMSVLIQINQTPTPTTMPINEKPITTKPIPIREFPVNQTTTNTSINDTATVKSTVVTLSYDSNSALKSALAAKGILMSNPLKFSGGAIAKYCTFYGDAEKQKSIEYCTSTELKDSNSKFLGNIHMVGSMNSTDAVLGIIQTDPFMSNLDSLKTTYQVMVESLVCDCWQDKKPGNLESVSAWVDAVKSHHLEAKKITSNSDISGLAQKHLILEVSTNTEGYLWKFIITN